MDRETFESKLKDLLKPIHELHKQYMGSNPKAEMSGLNMYSDGDSYSAFVINQSKNCKADYLDFYYADFSVYDEFDETEEEN